MAEKCDRPNVIDFMSDPIWAEMWHDRVVKNLEPDYVAKSFFATTAEAFREITEASGGTWHLLVIDAEIASGHIDAIRRFIEQNPQARVAIQYAAERDLPARPPIAGAKVFARASDIDDWLALMHGLISGAA